MTSEEFDIKCKELCPHCAAGEVARLRTDSNEWAHDFSFGNKDPKTGRSFGQGHGICQAHDFRTQNKDQLSG